MGARGQSRLGGRTYNPTTGRATSSSTSSGGQSFDPYIRDAQGNPIGTAAPPPGATPESIRVSQRAAGGGGGSGGGGGAIISPTTGQQIGTSATPSSFVGGVQKIRTVAPTRERTFTFKDDFGDKQFQTRQPTAKEQVLQQSIPTSGIETKQAFKEQLFFESILQQRKEFEAAPGESRFGMSTPEGGTAFFVPDIGRAEAAAGQGFKELPKQERFQLQSRERGVALTRGVVGLVTFVPDVLVGLGKGGKIKEGEKLRLLDTPFGTTDKALEKAPFIGDSFRELRETPIGFQGKIIEFGVPLVVGGAVVFKGFKGFKALRGAGLTRKEALIETAGFVSPLRPKPGVFTQKLTGDEPFQFFSTIKTKPSGIKVRRIKGFGEEFIIDSKQAFKKLPGGEEVSVGAAETKIIQPGFRVGGAKVKEGLVVRGFKDFGLDIAKPGRASVVKDVGIGKGRVRKVEILEDPAGVSKIGTVQQPRFSLFLEGQAPGKVTGFGQLGGRPTKDIRKIGGLSREFGSIGKEIVLGRGRPVLRKEGIKFRFKPTVRGLEFDISPKDIGVSNVKILRPTGRVTKTSFAKTFGEQAQLQPPKPIFPKQTTIPQVKAIQSSLAETGIIPQVKAIQSSLAETGIRVPTTSQFAGTGLYERTEGGLLPGQMVRGRDLTLSPLTLTTQKQFVLQAPKIKGVVSPRIRQGEIAITIPKQQEGLKIRQEERLMTASEFARPTIKPPRFTFDFGFRSPTPLGMPFFPPLGFGGGKKKKKGKRKFIETPTFAGVNLGEFGTKFKGQRTKRERALGVPLEVGFKKVKLPTTL